MGRAALRALSYQILVPQPFWVLHSHLHHVQIVWLLCSKPLF